MKILPVSPFSSQSGKINFEKKDKQQNSSIIPSSVKSAVPTAALILAMMADPLSVNKAEAVGFETENIEVQARPQHRAPQHRAQPHRQVPFFVRPYSIYPNIALSIILFNYLQSIANNSYYNSYNSEDWLSVGNTAFNKNDIVNVENFPGNNREYTSVMLKNGTRVTFPHQSSDRYAVIYRDVNGYVFEGLANAYIEGSGNSDNYTIKGCRNTSVDVGNDARLDRVFVAAYRILPDGGRQYTENVDVTANSGDVVNNRRVLQNNTTFSY